MVEPDTAAGSGVAEELMPFDGIDVEAEVEPHGPAPSGRSLTAPERVDIERQLRPADPEAAG
jgi:hypothetical protein